MACDGLGGALVGGERRRGRRDSVKSFDDVGERLRRMRPRDGDDALVLGGEALGRVEPAVGGQQRDRHFARGRVGAQFVEHFADVGREDVHVDEHEFQVGRLLRPTSTASRPRLVASASMPMGGELAGQSRGAVGDRRHRHDGAALAGAARRTSRALRARGWSRG